MQAGRQAAQPSLANYTACKQTPDGAQCSSAQSSSAGKAGAPLRRGGGQLPPLHFEASDPRFSHPVTGRRDL